MRRVGWLSSDLLSRLQSGADQVGPQVEQTHLGVGDVGDGVEGAQDGVLGLVAKSGGQQTPCTKSTKGSKQGSILTSTSWH